MSERVKLSEEESLLPQCKSREVANILGGFLGGLVGFIDVAAVRTAVQWWAECDEAWAAFEAMNPTKMPCAGCKYINDVPDGGGFCYMFKEAPETLPCGAWKADLPR